MLSFQTTAPFQFNWVGVRQLIGVSVAIALFAVWVGLFMSGPAQPAPRVHGPARWVTAAFGAAWPFTVEAGTVRCREWDVITFNHPRRNELCA